MSPQPLLRVRSPAPPDVRTPTEDANGSLTDTLGQRAGLLLQCADAVSRDLTTLLIPAA
jgi:hypothetical protein